MRKISILFIGLIVGVLSVTADDYNADDEQLETPDYTVVESDPFDAVYMVMEITNRPSYKWEYFYYQSMAIPAEDDCVYLNLDRSKALKWSLIENTNHLDIKDIDKHPEAQRIPIILETGDTLDIWYLNVEGAFTQRTVKRSYPPRHMTTNTLLPKSELTFSRREKPLTIKSVWDLSSGILHKYEFLRLSNSNDEGLITIVFPPGTILKSDATDAINFIKDIAEQSVTVNLEREKFVKAMADKYKDINNEAADMAIKRINDLIAAYSAKDTLELQNGERLHLSYGNMYGVFIKDSDNSVIPLAVSVSEPWCVWKSFYINLHGDIIEYNHKIRFEEDEI